jgi:hypothetical protein
LHREVELLALVATTDLVEMPANIVPQLFALLLEFRLRLCVALEVLGLTSDAPVLVCSSFLAA